MDLISIYFDAWKNKNLNIINIFSENAIYRVKPYNQEEYIGIQNIIEYWKNNPMQQDNPDPKIIECFSNNDNINTKIFCEFMNVFNITSSQKKKTHGMILFKIQNNKIYELSEFYKSIIEQ
jgi:hypothetical protein